MRYFQTITIGLVLALASAAGAVPNGPVKQYMVSASTLGVSAGDLSGTVTSNSFNTIGWSQMTLSCSLTWAAASQLQIKLQHSENWGTTDAAATWRQRRAGVAAVSGASVVETLRPHEIQETVSASAEFEYSIPLNHERTRWVITSTGGTTDVISCTVRLGAL